MSFNAFGAKIKVIGVGGGGGNAVNTMIRSGLEGVDFIVANTDAQALAASLAPNKIQLGKDLTKGLGAGADPDIGRDAALEDCRELQAFLSDADMVFITAGMGGGTGTGAAAVVAQIARELGALTVAVVTKPFAFEGKRRRKHAEQGVARLRECVDTLITIPNQRLLQIATPDLSMLDAFKLADNVLVNAVRGISDIINTPGLINVDFADVKTVMSSMGHALMGIGYGAGTDRALNAAKQAIASPLLEDVDIEGATGILINITAGTNVSIMEVNNACMVIQEAAHEDANIIFGAVIEPELGDEIRITVIATGFPVEDGLPAEDAHGAGRTLPPPAARGVGHSAPAPQRLVAPPRLTSPVSQSTVRDRQAFQSPAPVVQAPMTSFGAAQHVHTPAQQQGSRPPLPQSAGELGSALSKPSEVPSMTNFAQTHTRAPEVMTATEAAANATPTAVDVALEASTLANWTVDEQDRPAMAISEDLSQPLIERFDAPGTLVFHEVSSPSKTTAEQVFSNDGTEEVGLRTHSNSDLAEDRSFSWGSLESAEEESRAGAVLASEEFSWDFDTPNPGVVSDEIDRRIDEALALAEKMSELGAPAAETASMPARGQSSLDLDDLDLPAFLRMGVDTRQGG
jgi:cell division protein FtsZ